MKYLYKAMENLGDSSGNAVLGWHEKVSLVRPLTSLSLVSMETDVMIAGYSQLTEVAGIGCIVRVMTDRRRV